MDERGFAFEERKQDNGKYNNFSDMEFNKGGGGGGSRGFFSVKTNVYSKECYSDPNNPGKMICKETNNLSGYDPFNKEMNYNRSKENVYTRDYGANQNYYHAQKEESFLEKISGKIKGIFSSNNDNKGIKPVDYNSNNYNSSPQYNYTAPTYNQHDQSRNNLNQYVKDTNNNNKISGFNMNQDNLGFFSRDPVFDEFERFVNNLNSSFFKGGFFEDDEADGNFSQVGFGHFFGGGFPFDKEVDDEFGNFFHNKNFQRNSNNFSQASPAFNQNGFNHNFDNHNSHNNFNQRNNLGNQTNLNDSEKEIKFRDSKIYDV